MGEPENDRARERKPDSIELYQVSTKPIYHTMYYLIY